MSMSKQSNNNKKSMSLTESTPKLSNRFEALSLEEQKPRKNTKTRSDQNSPKGFDRPNWRTPDNNAFALYTKTPRKGSNQPQINRRKLKAIGISAHSQLRHHNPKLSASEHWRLANNTFEKQAYLLWSRENQVAIKNKQPQIPYDSYAYIRRIKNQIKEAQQARLEREAWRFFCAEREDWSRRNPNQSWPDWLNT